MKRLSFAFGATMLLATLDTFAAADNKIIPCEKSKNIDGQGTAQYFGNDGWIFESWEFNDDYQFTASDSLQELVTALKAHGSTLILIPTPFRTIKYANNITPSDALIKKFSKEKYISAWKDMLVKGRATGATVVDLLPAIQSFKASGRGENFYYPRDHHWTTSGAELAAGQVAVLINNLIKANSMAVSREKSTLSFKSFNDLLGSFGEHYSDSCGKKPSFMKRFEAKVNNTSSDLIGSTSTIVGIFGDSFGQAYPDNNFSQFIENKTQLATTNYSVSGGGPTVALAGYLADATVRQHLPPFLVVPFQGWLSNNYFDYGQITAAIVGCSKDRMIDSFVSPSKAIKASFTPSADNYGNVERILHVTTSIPTNYFEVRGKYADDSDLRYEIYRTSADYYKGSRKDFYAVLPSNQAVKVANIKIEGDAPFTAKFELCTLKDHPSAK